MEQDCQARIIVNLNLPDFLAADQCIRYVQALKPGEIRNSRKKIADGSVDLSLIIYCERNKRAAGICAFAVLSAAELPVVSTDSCSCSM